jgi:hypothetical protein
MATPAITSGMLIIRTKSHVYAVGKPRHETALTQASLTPNMPAQRSVPCRQSTNSKRRCHRLCRWRH